MPETLLEIDAQKTAERIENYLRRLVKDRKKRGVILGLSGGVDSAVMATLAVRALGRDRVSVMYIYDLDNDKESERKARLMSDFLGLHLIEYDMYFRLKRYKVYRPIVKIGRISGLINKMFIARLYSVLFKEMPFVSTLKAGSGKLENKKLKRFFYEKSIGPIEKGFNARHRMRRMVLEKQAEMENLLTIGAANRSESLVGWFVKDGIDDMPVMPMMKLYKTQTRQLGRFMGIPDEIMIQLASPDMMKGITDEFAIGILYHKIDIIMDGTERGLSEDEISKLGVTKEEIDYVKMLNSLSAWKRETYHELPPVDGGPGSELRMDIRPTSS
jgi:NAD+ synthase